MEELENHNSLTRNGSHVVSLLQKKTPTGLKIGGTKFNSYRTIEEAKIRDSGDQPDAPKQSNKIIQHQLKATPLANFNFSSKNNIKL